MGIDRIDSTRLAFPDALARVRQGATAPDGPPRVRLQSGGPDAATGLPSAPKLAPSAGEGSSFTKLLGNAIQDVNAMQNESAGKIEAFVRGEDVPLHEVVLAQEEAEISFRLLLETRDRLVRAYQEILRTSM